MKKIIILCDGTWQSEDSKCPSNVIKLSKMLIDDQEQRVIYDQGLGTGSGLFNRFFGGAFGRGINDNIKEVYGKLVEIYQPGDEIILFGFSRGAYTVRSLAGLIYNCGVLKSANNIQEAFDYYRNRNNEKFHPKHPFMVDYRAKNSYDAEVLFIGVWDTVGSLGIPLTKLEQFNQTVLDVRFHDVKLNKRVKYAFQALAIDEKRNAFEPSIWEQAEDAVDQQMEQVWFAGVHSDIGGGNKHTGLSDIALNWMIEKSKIVNLKFKLENNSLKPNPLGQLEDSLTWYYRLLPYSYRSIKINPKTTHEKISKTAKDRFEKDRKYQKQAKNLAEGFQCKIPVE